MPKQLWTSLDEFYGAPEVEAAKSSEFGADVERRMQAIREEYGIDEHGEIKDSSAPRNDSPEHIKDLRELLPNTSRRGFLKLTGAAAVFGMAGCWHEAPETLVPYVQQPENSILAKGVYYSSTLRNNAATRPVMVKLYDGRPIKIEGNPDYAAGKGTLDINGQAALLDLYDPDRRCLAGNSDGPLKAGAAGLEMGDWDAIDAQVGKSLSAGQIGLITGPWDGPSRERLLAELEKGFGGRLQAAAYHPFAADVARQARGIAFGADAANDPVYHAADAAVLVTFGSDFLGGGTARLEDHVEFGDQRRVVGHGASANMGQLIAYEATVTQSGTSADIRTRVSMEDMTAVAWYVAKKVAEKIKAPFPKAAEAAAEAGKNVTLEKNPALDGTSVVDYTVERLVDVFKHKHNSLVYVGGAAHTGEQSLGLYLAANYLNAILGNEGVTVSAPKQTKASSLAETEAVLKAAAAKQIKTLIIAEANLAYDWPDRKLVEDAVAGAELTVVIADRVNETAALNGVDIVLPTLHDLESWGDASSKTGQYFVQQPCVLPLWNARALEESLMAFAVNAGVNSFKYTIAKDETFGKLLSFVEQRDLYHAPQHGVQSWQSFVQATWQSAVHAEVGAAAKANDFWRAALSRGVVNGAAIKNGAGALQAANIKAAHIVLAKASGLSLIANASRLLQDGSQANNAWLQEAGDPVSRNTWDNYLAISLADAHELEIRQNQVVKVTAGDKTAYLPAHIQPGMAKGTVETFLGWGREEDRAGAVANGAGVDVAGNVLNAYALAGSFNRWGVKVSIDKTDDWYKLACLQGHQYMEGRDVAKDDVLEAHQKDPAAGDRGKHHHHLWHPGQGTTDPSNAGIAPVSAPLNEPNNLSMWDSTHVYTGRRWGMVIDMNTCTGCNACVVACSAENNVPVVGRDEVRIGREMHWIRIDRYYSTYMSDADKDTHGVSDGEKIEGKGFYGQKKAADDSFLEFIQQPMLCQQCGHAPCEEVCPAMATMHNEEGVNVQVYNRCIGTRYCANNCPYKVRRFNFYEYSKYRFGPQGSGDPLKRVVKNLSTDFQTSGAHEMLEAPLQMMLNPAVTVRSKGVMEKCNFCISRTREFREEEKRTNKKYDESSMTSACAQTCPTQAITFGDINDPDSTVSQMRASKEHGYLMLDYVLNTRPAITYLKRVRNRPGFAEGEIVGGKGHGDHGDDGHAKEEAH